MKMTRIDRATAEPAFAGLAAPTAPAGAAADVMLQGLLDAMPVAAGIVVLRDGEPTRLAINRRLEQVFGRELRGPAEIVDGLRDHLSGRAANCSFFWTEPGVGGRHFRANLSALGPDPRHGARTLVTLVDRTAEVETERSLRSEMLRDSLTGLPNRTAFAEAVEAALEDAARPRFALLSLDLTRFSRVNESIGALAGDELIITVARRLVSVVRAGDMIARVSGDEFAVLVRLTDEASDVLDVAHRLKAALTMPLRLSELEIGIDCAIGCAVRHEETESAAEIIRNAQLALKRAKHSAQIEVYQPGEVRQARRRFSLETELRRAIAADGLALAFQPLVALDGGRVAGFEVLCRWNHPERGSVPPVEFITVAEESGLILPLGRWVLERALRTLAQWDAAASRTLPIYLGVNVSPVQLARDTVAAAAAEALAAHGIDGRRLTLELTESSIIADPDRAAGVLNALKALSCRIAMDDFGTGYSNLAYLQRLPIDILKIDRGFVAGLLEDHDSTAIVRAILSLASALNMSTIAEGVETEQAARTLGALGARFGQGYHFARPMPADAALAYLLASSPGV